MARRDWCDRNGNRYLPLLRIGGMQLFRMESSDRSEKVLPRTTQLVAYIAFIYLGASVVCALAYWAAGMSGFDNAHAMTTATADSRPTMLRRTFQSATIEYICVIFMLIGSLPFVLYLWPLRQSETAVSRRPSASVPAHCRIAVLILACYRHAAGTDTFTALREAAFNVVSIIPEQAM